MTLATYNGFDHAQRMKALRWLKAEYSAGRRRPPTVCEVCGQTEGPLSGHSENYSEPFGDHIGQHGLCYRCHMMIHCRFKNVEAWVTYKRHVREGKIFTPLGRAFQTFCGQTLTRRGRGVPFEQGPVKERTLLDSLSVIPRETNGAIR